MIRRLSQFAMFLAAASLLTIPAMAKPASGDSLVTNISVSSTTMVQNKSLEPGSYKVVVEGNEAKFMQGNKLVTEVPCTIKTLPNKAQYSEIVTDHGRLTEIEMSGKTQAIEFGS